jgi:hypothetical protein
LIFDEALARGRDDRSFRFFIDALCEGVVPYLEERQQRRQEVAELLASGQLALVGGQYANLRPATAAEEMYLRNLEEGWALLAEWFPGVAPLGYANLDTAIGHSQLPQVLALAGCRYLMAGRPELGLELDGVPKVFRWRGAADSEVLVLVQHYGIMERGLRALASPDSDRRREGAALCRDLLAAHGRALPSVQWAFLGADDMRYARDHVTDAPVDIGSLRQAWREEMGTELVASTPDDLFRDVQEHASELAVLTGPVDQADVGYNGPFGPGELRGLRDRAAAGLVEAELAAALFQPAEVWPGDELRRLWRLALRAQTHATQYLFREDLADLRLDLENVARSADDIRCRASEAVAPAAFPHETRTVTVLNPLPRPVRTTVPIQVLRTDFSVAGYAAAGCLLQQPVTPVNPGRPGEWELLVEMELPACGLRSVELVPGEKAETPPSQELPLTSETVLGPLTLRWENGLLIEVSRPGHSVRADVRTSLLEPLRRPATIQGWMTTALAVPDSRCTVTRLRQMEFGPLRWAVEREATVAEHAVWQRFEADRHGDLTVTTEIDYGLDSCMFSLAMPCAETASLRASIPFGAEPRDLAATHYSPGGTGDRVIERLIPGMFYARDWVRQVDDGVALLVLDGDRYWLRRTAECRLEHLLTRVCPPARDGWVSRTDLAGAGRTRVRHMLVLGPDAADEPGLDERTDRVRFPMRSWYSVGSPLDGVSQLSVTPRNVRLLSLRWVGDEWEAKLVENGDADGVCRVAFAGPVESARLVDLRGNTLARAETGEDGRVSFPVSPRQIRILRVTPRR